MWIHPFGHLFSYSWTFEFFQFTYNIFKPEFCSWHLPALKCLSSGHCQMHNAINPNLNFFFLLIILSGFPLESSGVVKKQNPTIRPHLRPINEDLWKWGAEAVVLKLLGWRYCAAGRESSYMVFQRLGWKVARWSFTSCSDCFSLLLSPVFCFFSWIWWHSDFNSLLVFFL